MGGGNSRHQEIHFGVVCDGCNEAPLRGRRYRCLMCDDFDLCLDCYSARNEIHPEHRFCQIAQPGHHRRRDSRFQPREMHARPQPMVGFPVIDLNAPDDGGVDINYMHLYQLDRLLNELQLLRLILDAHQAQPAESVSLRADRDTIDALPVCPYPQSPDIINAVGSEPLSLSTTLDKQEFCCVCMESFVENENVLHMPCAHMFHKECIYEWFQNQHKCPVCRFALKLNVDDVAESGDGVRGDSLSIVDVSRGGGGAQEEDNIVSAESESNLTPSLASRYRGSRRVLMVMSDGTPIRAPEAPRAGVLRTSEIEMRDFSFFSRRSRR